MDADLAALSEETDLATQRLLDDARILDEDDLRAPSRLPGWSRAHVLAHLARRAAALRHLLAGSRGGAGPTGWPPWPAGPTRCAPCWPAPGGARPGPPAPAPRRTPRRSRPG